MSTVKDMLEGHSFGGAGRSVVIEEFMEGEEASVLCFCDGTTVVPMVSSQDHKRILMAIRDRIPAAWVPMHRLR